MVAFKGAEGVVPRVVSGGLHLWHFCRKYYLCRPFLLVFKTTHTIFGLPFNRKLTRCRIKSNRSYMGSESIYRPSLRALHFEKCPRMVALQPSLRWQDTFTAQSTPQGHQKYKFDTCASTDPWSGSTRFGTFLKKPTPRKYWLNGVVRNPTPI